MDIHGKPVMTYRWVTFLLAGGYCLYQLLSSDYSAPGGPFRFLTIWALFLSFFAASRMLARSEKRTSRTHHRTAMTAAILNVMVVFLYWKLFFTDPALVNGGGDIPFLQQYYLHALGPALQVFDALFIARAFGRPWRAIPVLVGVIAAYVAWAELFVQRFNDQPSGSLTSGLPYPFLNSLDTAERMTFYSTNVAVAVGLLAMFGALHWLLFRAQPAETEQEPAPQN